MSKMRRFFRSACVLMLAVLIGISVGCGGRGGDGGSAGGNGGGSAGGDGGSTPGGGDIVAQKYDPETRPLGMSISLPDGVFNPFFATSAYDSVIAGITQVSMLSSDELGNVTYGDDEPVVVKDMKIETGQTTTTYKFILKNGIKFSDGQPLTIKDVLFNLYVYLDPVYAGSATIYSTKIVGLNQYRMQNPDADISDDAVASFEEQFYDKANMHMSDLTEYVQLVGKYPSDEKPTDRFTQEQKEGFKKDFEIVSKEFKKELETDWNSSADSKESYKDWKGFTETWQIFLLNDGGMTELLAKNPDGTYIKDKDGNYSLNEDEAAYYADLLNEYMTDNNLTDKEAAAKEWAIDLVYGTYFPGTVEATDAKLFERILNGWMTGEKIRDQFVAEAKSEYFASHQRAVPTISGINGSKKRSKDFSGKDLGAEHEVLEITIKDVDPKAIWNFAFTVAPMHYYSSHNYNGKDYIKAFDAEKGEFGLEFGDTIFMNKVINAPEKVGLPVGAGTYKASDQGGSDTPNAGTFFNNNMIYFKRNDYFETLNGGSADSRVKNAKIKYVRYKVVETDQVINALSNGEIDYGEPSATQENIGALEGHKDVSHKEAKTSGYGYVGINPRFVPNISVRRAIMRAMDTRIITSNYYKGGLAELIYRPMSTTSWAYPQGVGVYKDDSLGLDYSYDSTGYEIEKMVKDAGYVKNANGVYEKDIPGFGTDTLDYKFTIAGGSTDHPAYAMFIEAAKILNSVGFDVKVVHSQTALSDLSTGKLAIWAAAWSSTIDPDMYQIYHKDSRASSVNNWGYKQIKAHKNDYFSTEWTIINELSELIDAGRETVDQGERTDIYAAALDKIMELAVEMPTYQRKDMFAFNSKVLNRATMTPDSELTHFNGLISRMWELNYN